ncbi:lipid A export permease/ATP-binding protein MsbA [Candidatus Berkiella aquae]|nr:lipid A export permease/ATP-binding protein MsbA [Candidatus Berkiella aquae]MCS5711789.1 lipid A export permease/ATP-binding protein MsbA [Candidatus Berkiella aquae]
MTSPHTSPISGKVVYRRLLSYVWPYRYAFMLAILGNILYGVIDAGITKLLQPLLNQGFVDHDVTFIHWIPFVVIGIFILRGVATFLSTFFMGWVGRNVVMNFRQEMFAHMMRLPTSYYDHTSSGEILSKIIYNVEQVADASSDALTVLVRESCTAIGLIVVMLSISWRLTLLFIITVPLMAIIMSGVSKRMRAVSARIQASMGNVTHVAEEAIEGQKVIKAFGGQAYETEQFKQATQNNRRQEMKLIATSATSIPMIQVIGSVALAITVYLATLNPEHVLRTAITPGAFAAMMAAMIMLLKPIKQLTKVNSNIQKGIAGAASIFAFLDEKPEVDTGTQIIPSVQGNMAFRQVSFSYAASEGQKTLSNISFEVKAGETIAIVGRSGAGKSTIASLLPRFYEAQGEILIDGVNVKTMPLSHLRKQIAVVSQQVTLFNDTVARNIAYGQDDATREQIIAAAESAYAMDFIEGLPEGLDTLIGDNGVRLSGGQRQRIAIARAILKKAPILVLDEATSALDTESERHIQAALDKLMASCTTLVIAHRLSTIENANRIMVIDQGRIAEMGTHEALMAKKGLYANLRLMQYNQVTATIPELELETN